MKKCIKINTDENSFRYEFRNSPPYHANDCKTMKKKGNDGKLYLSQPDKNGIYKWVPVNKNKTQKNRPATSKDLQMLVKKYSITKSGSNKQIAQRLMQVRGHVIKNKSDLKIIKQFL